MLHTKTVEPKTLKILKILMNMPELQDFSLVGGAALSLYYGHRKAVDIDLFSTNPVDQFKIFIALKLRFGDKMIVDNVLNDIGVICHIDGVKVDIIRFPHPQIRPSQNNDGIRMYAKEDLVAMKVHALFARGMNKDVWDLEELHKHFSASDFIQFHKEKYTEQT
jgi:hypothetical protein